MTTRANTTRTPGRGGIAFIAAALASLFLLSCENKDIIPDEIESPPLARFTFSVTPAEGGTTVVVDASTSTDAQDPVTALQVRWDWDADGVWDTDYATAKSASHFYPGGLEQMIRLEVRDTAGLVAQASLLAAFVAPLSCEVVALPVAGPAPLTVEFEGQAFGGTGDYSFKWRFGDGRQSSEQNPSHTFSAAGTYQVVMTLTDAHMPGVFCADSVSVQVGE
jgi:PKD repeat protein